MTLKLYEFAVSRSARVRWTLAELGLSFESRSGADLFGSDELKRVHPLGKLPAFEDDGRPLFESAAICSWLADKHPDKELIAAAGSWDRALHDQWVAFALTEIEAHLWSNARNTFVYPEKHRIQAVLKQNDRELKRSLPVLDAHFKGREFIVGDKFSVTDIIVGYATNWARRRGVMGEFDNVLAYNQRLLDRPLCPYSKDA